MNEFSGREFRDALSTFATGVTIVTASGPDGPVGMTASSFNSVSVDPPLVLWSVAKTALSAPVFEGAEHFSVHVLASDQSALSNRFARSGADKFGRTPHTIDGRGVPVIAGVASRFDCRTWAVHDGGDHSIIVGHVDAIATSGAEGLIFGGGTYATASPLVRESEASADAAEPGGPIDDLVFTHLSRLYHQIAAAFHEVVRGSGLTVAEWRVAASLYGEATRTRGELARRTFLDPVALDDVLVGMEADGLCRLDGQEVTGTPRGNDTVAHLFRLAEEQEAEALVGLSLKERDRFKETLRHLGEGAEPALRG